MVNVYKIMDTTGDGRLSWKEIKAGFEKIAPDLHPSDDEGFFKEICANCDFSHTNSYAISESGRCDTIDYGDFLIAATKVDDEHNFITYMKNAYE
tara:strand:+ start:458 stop:742 length:285 start_codon:yes stop_codon:yes gene_type:complete